LPRAGRPGSGQVRRRVGECLHLFAQRRQVPRHAPLGGGPSPATIASRMRRCALITTRRTSSVAKFSIAESL
jgi:hypothetical protein